MLKLNYLFHLYKSVTMPIGDERDISGYYDYAISISKGDKPGAYKECNLFDDCPAFLKFGLQFKAPIPLRSTETKVNKSAEPDNIEIQE